MPMGCHNEWSKEDGRPRCQTLDRRLFSVRRDPDQTLNSTNNAQKQMNNKNSFYPEASNLRHRYPSSPHLSWQSSCLAAQSAPFANAGNCHAKISAVLVFHPNLPYIQGLRTGNKNAHGNSFMASGSVSVMLGSLAERKPLTLKSFPAHSTSNTGQVWSRLKPDTRPKGLPCDFWIEEEIDLEAEDFLFHVFCASRYFGLLKTNSNPNSPTLEDGSPLLDLGVRVSAAYEALHRTRSARRTVGPQKSAQRASMTES